MMEFEKNAACVNISFWIIPWVNLVKVLHEFSNNYSEYIINAIAVFLMVNNYFWRNIEKLHLEIVLITSVIQRIIITRKFDGPNWNLKINEKSMLTVYVGTAISNEN